MSLALDPPPTPWTLGRIGALTFQRSTEADLDPADCWEAVAIAIVEHYAKTRAAGDCRTPRQRFEGIPVPTVDACPNCGTTGNRTWGDPVGREGWICLGCGEVLA